jgi:hypothetical protein
VGMVEGVTEKLKLVVVLAIARTCGNGSGAAYGLVKYRGAIGSNC